MSRFRVVSELRPQGDQPAAIESLSQSYRQGASRQVLLGVTGSGKTFTVAHLIEQLQLPTLVVAPNKTLAGQLYTELRGFLPDNAVEYFVSYYDYFQPEAYLPASDTYIEKDARVNETIDRMRNAATASLLSRPDVVVVASVSCLYGLGDPENYLQLALSLAVGTTTTRQQLLLGLVRTQYRRAEVDFRPGTFRVRGGAIEVWPIHERERLLRVELANGAIAALLLCAPATGELLDEIPSMTIYPVGHYVTPEERLRQAMPNIAAESKARCAELRAANRLLEAERLERRVLDDLEELEELGHCQGIENYARHLDGREPGQPPFTLLHYFPREFLVVIDESHLTLPQIGGMQRGDLARKRTLVEHGFRLPSAVDNRPLSGEEFDSHLDRVLYVSATPRETERRLSEDRIVRQVIRPTGLLDPIVEVRPATGQVENLLGAVREAVEGGGRVLVTTLTKRSAEDLSEFFQEQEVRARYMHADIDTLGRAELLRDLRLGLFDVLIGVNLLREGLDLPEVVLVAVLDADREGFLRTATSLIQTCGRAARHAEGRVLLYADEETAAIRETLVEAEARRNVQAAWNREHGVVPRTIIRPVGGELVPAGLQGDADGEDPGDDRVALETKLASLRQQMLAAAADLEFETAIEKRNEMQRLEARLRHLP